MAHLPWDASALAKRHAPETGSQTVDALFQRVPTAKMAVTFLGYSETFATLSRKHNRRAIATTTFQAAKRLLRAEVLDDPDFGLLTLDDIAVLDGMNFIEQHNINSADAAILAVFLEYAQSLPQSAGTCVLVASDQRFLRAAQAEGLAVLDPETVDTADVPALLATF